MKKTLAKFHKEVSVEELRSQEVSTVFILRVVNDLIHNAEKEKKNDLTIISKPHAHSHTIKAIGTKL